MPVPERSPHDDLFSSDAATSPPGVSLAAACVLLAAPLAAQPSSQFCSNAVTIPGAGPFPFSAAPINTSGSVFDQGGWTYPCLTGKSFTLPLDPNAVSRTVWYSFTPAVTDTYRIDTAGSTPAGEYDTILEVYTGICGSLQPVTNGCNDDTQTSLLAQKDIVLTANNTYYISVSGVGGRDTFNPNVIRPSNGGTLQFKIGRVPVVFAYSYIVPSVAHAQGITLFVSDLNLTNLESSDAIFTVQFLGHGNFGDQSQPASQPITSNITVSGLRLAGADRRRDVAVRPRRLRVAPRSVHETPLRRRPDVYAVQRPYRRYLRPVRRGRGRELGRRSRVRDPPERKGRFIGVREDADTRTNFVLFNTGSTVCNVALEVRDANGNTIAPGGISRGLPPKTMVQANKLKNTFNITSDIRNASLVVTSLNGGCTIGGVAYVLDGNINPNTNDPFTVTFRK